LDRAFDYGSKGWEFESLRARTQKKSPESTNDSGLFNSPGLRVYIRVSVSVTLVVLSVPEAACGLTTRSVVGAVP